MFIQSANNQRIKDLLRLRQKRDRLEQGRFGVEGMREISQALAAGFKVQEVYFCQKSLSSNAKKLLEQMGSAHQVEVTAGVFQKLVLRENSDGLFVVFRYRHFGLEAFDAGIKAPLYVLVDEVEKPGNIGAILRSADGAGVHGVVIVSDSFDLFNPNVVRASLGAVFTVPTVSCSLSEALIWAEQRNVQLVVAAPDAKQNYFDVDMNLPTALILGSEAGGVRSAWYQAKLSRPVVIPMLGKVDSLNVSVAAAVLMYEARRQRLVRSSD